MPVETSNKVQLVDRTVLFEDGVVAAYVPASFEVRNARMIPPQLIVAAIQYAIKARNEANFANWQQDVSSSLAEISRKLDQILVELAGLKVFIKEEIQRSIVQVYSEAIFSKGRIIEDVLAANDWELTLDEDQKGVIRPLYYGIVESLYSLANPSVYGYAGHQAVCSGACSAIVGASSIGISDLEFDRIKKFLISYLESALDPNNDRSIEFARNSLAIDYVAASNEFSSRLNRWWAISWGIEYDGGIGIRSDDTGFEARRSPTGRKYACRTVYITGSLDAGLAYQFVGGLTYANDKQQPFPDIPYGRFDCGDVNPSEYETRLAMDRLVQNAKSIGQRLAQLTSYVEAIRAVRDELSQ